MSILPVNAVPDVHHVSLPGVDGRNQSLSTLAGRKGTVVIFFANGCPTARAYEQRLAAMYEAGQNAGMSLVAINANNRYLSPGDTLEEMQKRARDRGFPFPYLKDENGTLAKGFGAVCTPHAFLLDDSRRIVYSGRIDDSRLGDKITSTDLENAIGDLLAGRRVAVSRTDPFGCSIVW